MKKGTTGSLTSDVLFMCSMSALPAPKQHCRSNDLYYICIAIEKNQYSPKKEPWLSNVRSNSGGCFQSGRFFKVKCHSRKIGTIGTKEVFELLSVFTTIFTPDFDDHRDACATPGKVTSRRF